MRSKYLLIIFFIFSISFIENAKGQNIPPKEYYIEIEKTRSKSVIKEFDSIVKSKPVVQFFSYYKTSHPFFILKTKQPISKIEFAGWFSTYNLKIIVFEEKYISAKEIINRKKNLQKDEKKGKAYKRQNLLHIQQ